MILIPMTTDTWAPEILPTGDGMQDAAETASGPPCPAEGGESNRSVLAARFSK